MMSILKKIILVVLRSLAMVLSCFLWLFVWFPLVLMTIESKHTLPFNLYTLSPDGVFDYVMNFSMPVLIYLGLPALIITVIRSALSAGRKGKYGIMLLRSLLLPGLWMLLLALITLVTGWVH